MSAMQDMTKGGAAGHLLRYAVPLMLGKGIALALEFMLASEVLRTVVSPDTKDLIAVGVTVLLRGAVAYEDGKILDDARRGVFLRGSLSA